MEDINNILSLSYINYFNTLFNTGYISQSKTDSLIILQAIQYILNNFYTEIKEEDLFKLNNLLQCINDGCLINITSSLNFDSLIKNITKQGIIRVESDNYKYTFNNNIRIA